MELQRDEVVAIVKSIALLARSIEEPEIAEYLTPLKNRLVHERDWLDDPIDFNEHLNLPIRAYNSLRRHGITTTRQLLELSTEDLYDMWMIGFGTVQAIEGELRKHGLELKGNGLGFGLTEFEKESRAGEERDPLDDPIEDLDLPIRAYNCLKREGINTVGELIQRNEGDLFDIRNFGMGSLDDVKKALDRLGLSLSETSMPWEERNNARKHAFGRS